ncbi:Ca2+-binding RTX toxin-like protein [Pantoea alhagi]|uniref:polyurethane esterase n=1 Tax=Mixta sp. BE291 TaxID=3158787 RepID=UPI0028546FAC|nr:Ca2+-binding RTX toxin-like protein [Pantoea alhagi]
MAIFDYQGSQNKSLISDALTLNAYSTELAGFTLDKSFQQRSEESGWKVLNAEDLSYTGAFDQHNIFSGENAFYWSAQVNVFGKYNEAGELVSIGVCYWGTGDVKDSPNADANTQQDGLHDILIALSSEFTESYVSNAFGDLLSCVARFATENGLTGKDVLFSGMSLGGMAVNSTAMASANNEWDGFYEDANYIAISSPVQNTADDKVLNLGCENDPVYRAMEGTTVNFPDSLFVHDKPLESCVNNLVIFNDYYASEDFTIFSIAGQMWGAWAGHDAVNYVEGLQSVLNSIYYNFTDKDSTVIVSRMSDEMRATTWVKDLNHFAEAHEGPTFILGSEKADLIEGGKGMDYLEGFGGNDIFRDAGGFNAIDGGAGYDLFDLQGEISKTSIAHLGGGTLAIKGADGGVTIMNNVEAIKETYWFLFQDKYITYDVTSEGLAVDGKIALNYANSVHGSEQKSSEIFAPENGGFYTNQTSWLVGTGQDTTMHGSTSSDVFVCQGGNDTIYTHGGDDTILFASENIGNNTVYGFGKDDKLAFMGNKEITANGNYLDYLTECEEGVQFTCDGGSVLLVGLTLDQVHESQFVLA